MRRERDIVEQNNSVQPGWDVKRWLTFDKMDRELSEDILEKSGDSGVADTRYD